MVKLSILSFYWKVFASNTGHKRNRLLIQAVAVACVVWFLIVTFLIIFQCDPIHAYWDELAAASYCLDTSKLLLGYEITNLALDVLILCIPIPIVLRLKLPSSKKAGLVGVFSLGAL